MAIDKRILIFLLVSIGLITLPHAGNIPLPLFAFFCLILIWRFVSIWIPTCLPNRFGIFLVTMAGIGLVMYQHQGILGRDAGTALFVTALGLKLLEINSSRDIYLIIYLAFIVASLQFLFLQNMLMAGYILLACCLLLATLVAFNSVLPQTQASLKTAALIIAQAFPMAVIIFVLFPRFEAPRWLVFENRQEAKTGLSDTLEPGAISRLGKSNELVFRVKFDGQIPPPLQRYWRGPVFTLTDGKRWTKSPRPDTEEKNRVISFQGTAYRYTLLMEPQNKHWVFGLDMPSDYSPTLLRNHVYQLITREDPNQRAEYRITSYPRYQTGALSAVDMQDSLQLPGEPTSRISAFVTQLRGSNTAPEALIQQLLNHFHTEKFYYTLTPEVMAENPIETFLFDSRSGFCSHYATAFVYLMRVAGIPARVVTGYQGGQYNEIGHFVEVRQANAHAWAEVWLSGRGWVRYDPTTAVAPERVEQDSISNPDNDPHSVYSTPVQISAAFWFKRGRQFWNSLDYNWQRWIINFSQINQTRFLSRLGIHDIAMLGYCLIASITLLTALLAWIILRSNRPGTDPVLHIYRRFCTGLAKQSGVQIKIGEGPLHFAQRAKLQCPAVGKEIDSITALFIKLRYQNDADSGDLKLFKQQVKNLSRAFTRNG